VVFRGTKTLAAQLIDDQAGKVLLTVRSPQAGLPAAAKLGAELAKLAKAKKLTSVVFDRAGYRYHGAVKAFGDAVREHGVTI
jgi:large subunit ribosomal protein L18